MHLSSNFDDLAVAVRPFRAIHHLREAKIINVSTGSLPRSRQGNA